jgi:hypothetical protein
MEDNFGDEGENNDTFRGQLAYGGLNVLLNLSYITTCHHLSYHRPCHQFRPSYTYYYDWSKTL